MNERLNLFGKQLGELLEFKNISVKEYAERIGTTPKNLIDIIEGRVSLSFNMICNIAFISEIPIDYIFNVEEAFKVDKNIDNYLNNNNLTIRNFINMFNYKELKEKYNVIYNNERDDYSIAEGIMKYLRVVDPYTILKEDNHIFYKSNNDKPFLLALWIERCLRVIDKQTVGIYKKENIKYLVNFVRSEARNLNFNKEKLINVFNSKGIFLAIEPDLDGAKIRGAFKVLNNKPAIFLTTKYKRYADIYFALLHELAHCKSDFNRAKKGSIVSIYDKENLETYEINADKTAHNWLVDDDKYNEIKNNLNIEKTSEIKSFLVYRLAHDKIITYSSKIYQENNPLIK